MSRTVEECLNISNGYFHERKYQEALMFCEEAIKVDSACARAYHGAGLILTKQGKYDKALKNYKKAIKLAPSNAQLYADVGELYFKLGFSRYNGSSPFVESHRYYQKAIELDRKYESAYMEKATKLVEEAEMLRVQGLVDKAIVAFQQAGAFNPNDQYSKQMLTDLRRRANLLKKLALPNFSIHPCNCSCNKCVNYQ